MNLLVLYLSLSFSSSSFTSQDSGIRHANWIIFESSPPGHLSGTACQLQWSKQAHSRKALNLAPRNNQSTILNGWMLHSRYKKDTTGNKNKTCRNSTRVRRRLGLRYPRHAQNSTFLCKRIARLLSIIVLSSTFSSADSTIHGAQNRWRGFGEGLDVGFRCFHKISFLFFFSFSSPLRHRGRKGGGGWSQHRRGTDVDTFVKKAFTCVGYPIAHTWGMPKRDMPAEIDDISTECRTGTRRSVWGSLGSDGPTISSENNVLIQHDSLSSCQRCA